MKLEDNIGTKPLKRTANNRNQTIRKRKIWAAIACSLVLICIGSFMFRKELAILLFDTFISNKVEATLDNSYKPIGSESEQQQEQTQPADQSLSPFSVLLLGIDQRKNEAARSDSIIYSVMRKKDNKILLLSIPRDSKAYIVGKDFETKINAAHAYGGAKMSVDTVENLLQVPVNYYATINFAGLTEIVDALGGVELPITKDIVNRQKIHEKFIIKAGKPIYTGEEALNYVRYREDSDMNRTERQRIFLNSLMNRVLSLNQITKLPQLLEIAGSNFTTNMKSNFMIELAKDIFKSGQTPQIESYMLRGSDAKVDGVYYYIIDEQDLNYVKELLQNWMNPNTDEANLMIPKSN
ncbi:LCP family protein [Paenibacillus sediminis]|uniref:LCP family protein required for cell wall assembly n=1 Tax=Paenibacillus sediminis TaxID=664909 RepID=A0ABS4H1H7_9BACL|nr:LCP family protein [Paenibacillus sediminis]MBP1936222.1 LCP family protein required for cell wall assembly [Paenibacillus sediminis]